MGLTGEGLTGVEIRRKRVKCREAREGWILDALVGMKQGRIHD